MVPPHRTTLLYLGYQEESEGDHRGRDCLRQLAVYAAVSKIENKGFTASILIHKGLIVLRSGVMHGVALKEVPSYLQEVAMLHSLRIVQEWFQKTSAAVTREISEVVIKAGDETTIKELRRWLHAGITTLSSAAMAPLMEDILRLGEWLHVPTRLYPYDPPAGREPQEMPWVHRAIFTQMEKMRMWLEYRTPAERETEQIPRVPLTKTEIREVLYRQMESDE